MPGQISQLKIINAVLDGIENAEKTYEQWSRGEWLAYSAEYVITVFVATSIMKIPGSKYLTIEHGCRDAIDQHVVKEGENWRVFLDHMDVLILSFGGQVIHPELLLKLKTTCTTMLASAKPI